MELIRLRQGFGAKRRAAFIAERGDAIEPDEIAPDELTGEDMARLKYASDADDEITFKEQLERMIAAGDKFPCLFATTEY